MKQLLPAFGLFILLTAFKIHQGYNRQAFSAGTITLQRSETGCIGLQCVENGDTLSISVKDCSKKL